MRPRLTASALLVPFALAACATGGARRGAAGDSVTLEVRNNYSGPVDLYAVREGGYVQRIASAVSTGRPARFRLGPAVLGPAGTLRIIAVPTVEGGRASTGRLVVRPGDTIQFNIAPDLATSAAFVGR